MSNLYRCFLPSVDSFDQAVSEEKIFRNVPIRNKNCLWRRCLLTKSGRNGQSLYRTFHRCFLPSFGSFVQAVSVQKIFLEINQSETRLSCGGHVCDGSRRNEHLYRGPSIDASYQVYVYLFKRFQKKRFF